jgi:hypothetical protein
MHQRQQIMEQAGNAAKGTRSAASPFLKNREKLALSAGHDDNRPPPKPTTKPPEGREWRLGARTNEWYAAKIHNARDAGASKNTYKKALKASIIDD